MTREEERRQASREYVSNLDRLPSELRSVQQLYSIDDFKEGAKWADKTLLDNACEWLLNHNDYQRVLDNGCSIMFDMTQCVMDFRKAMEE